VVACSNPATIGAPLQTPSVNGHTFHQMDFLLCVDIQQSHRTHPGIALSCISHRQTLSIGADGGRVRVKNEIALMIDPTAISSSGKSHGEQFATGTRIKHAHFAGFCPFAIGCQRSDGQPLTVLAKRQPPFTSKSVLELLAAHGNLEVTPPSRMTPCLPFDVEQINLKCMAKDPSDRFQNADELNRVLMKCSCASQWGSDQSEIW